jgi:hypothetical protein
VCHKTTNCIAATYDPDASDCEFLVRVNGSSGVGVSNICPLGVQDFLFGAPSPDGDILPGPCGM